MGLPRDTGQYTLITHKPTTCERNTHQIRQFKSHYLYQHVRNNETTRSPEHRGHVTQRLTKSSTTANMTALPYRDPTVILTDLSNWQKWHQQLHAKALSEEWTSKLSCCCQAPVVRSGDSLVAGSCTSWIGYIWQLSRPWTWRAESLLVLRDLMYVSVYLIIVQL